jgi:hypothetical protein
MASWIVFREGRGLDAVKVYYLNHITGVRYTLGSLSSDVPDTMILNWIFNHGGPAYGDRIQLSDGSLFHFKRPEGARA